MLLLLACRLSSVRLTAIWLLTAGIKAELQLTFCVNDTAGFSSHSACRDDPLERNHRLG